MGWWPFTRKRVDLSNDPQIKGTRTWLLDLQALCETHYDDRISGVRAVEALQEEWHQAHKMLELPDLLFEGLEKRTQELLICDDEKWILLLNDEAFWQPGWRPSNKHD
nr:hypothetical protein [Euryarchaeota archaeon]